VLQRVRHIGVELGLDAHRVESLYRAIMEMSIAHQQAYVHGLDDVPLRVAYQGIEGSNSHLAAQRRYAGRAGGALLTGYEEIPPGARRW
jgi:chorismate mutase/prephenate dehydratase